MFSGVTKQPQRNTTWVCCRVPNTSGHGVLCADNSGQLSVQCVLLRKETQTYCSCTGNVLITFMFLTSAAVVKHSET